MWHLPVRPDRLWNRLMELSRISSGETGVTRVAFTPAYVEGRAWLAAVFREAGLDVEVDHAGNLHGYLRGETEERLMLGGHSDTVPEGGAFDGALGVLSAVEIAQSLVEAGIVPRLTVDVVDFLAEEPTAFGLSCIGSRGFVGKLQASDLTRTDRQGQTLAAAIASVGGDPAVLRPVATDCAIRAFLELHIEQGPVLERHPGTLGVVTGIAGIERYDWEVSGEAGHAGTVPMALRKDALVAAAKGITVFFQETANVRDMVGTVGYLTIEPNAPNVIPGRVRAVAEFRALDSTRLRREGQRIMRAVQAVVESSGCSMHYTPTMDTVPTLMNERMVARLEQSLSRVGIASVRMPSGAGHDAVEIAQRTEVGMLFSPCRKGLSHCPEEWVEPSDVALALRGYAACVWDLLHDEERPSEPQ